MTTTSIPDQYRQDVDNALGIWTDIIKNDFENVEYAYVKGSSVKAWETKIDYVPFVSDVDIHFKYIQGGSFFENEAVDPVIRSMEITNLYEDQFTQKYPTAAHIPRIQLLVLDYNKMEEFTPPIPKQIKVLHGEPDLTSPPHADIIKERDRQNLLKDYQYVKNELPGSIIDRVGVEFWTVVRRLTWRVSPSPVRLLTQILEDEPTEMWTWNRTKIVRLLREKDFSEIADIYSDFYMQGWDLFDSGIGNYDVMKSMVLTAYHCIRKCAEALESQKH